MKTTFNIILHQIFGQANIPAIFAQSISRPPARFPLSSVDIQYHLNGERVHGAERAPSSAARPRKFRRRFPDVSTVAMNLHLQIADDNWGAIMKKEAESRIVNEESALTPQRNRLLEAAYVPLLAVFSLGCSSDSEAGTGSLTVLLEPEDVIVDGISAGTGPDEIHDGWSVQFESYIAAVGDIDLYLSTDESVEAKAGDVFVVDLKDLPASGEALWQFESLEAGSWEFHYLSAGAARGAVQHESVSDDDFELMVESDFTYLVRGTLTSDDGKSCPPASLATPGDEEPSGTDEAGNACYERPSVDFVIMGAEETRFGPCEIDGVSGVAIPDGGSQTVAISLHGDHLFFNGFPEGSEGGVARYGQWLADCDLDLDGTVTTEELDAIPLRDLPQIDDRYQLGATPITLVTVYDYVLAQFKTQGHYQGEGECPIDGVGSDH